MADVKSGKYTPADKAAIAEGDIIENAIDPETGLPVKVVTEDAAPAEEAAPAEAAPAGEEQTGGFCPAR